jgi:hypothetical protein
LRGSQPAVKSVVKFSWTAPLALTLALFAAVAFADPRPKQTSSRQPQKDEQVVFVTGSLIPQRVKLHPIATKTLSPVRIIDRREIDGTGRFTAPGAFVNEPSVRVIGH